MSHSTIPSPPLYSEIGDNTMVRLINTAIKYSPKPDSAMMRFSERLERFTVLYENPRIAYDQLYMEVRDALNNLPDQHMMDDRHMHLRELQGFVANQIAFMHAKEEFTGAVTGAKIHGVKKEWAISEIERIYSLRLTCA